MSNSLEIGSIVFIKNNNTQQIIEKKNYCTVCKLKKYNICSKCLKNKISKSQLKIDNLIKKSDRIKNVIENKLNDKKYILDKKNKINFL